MSTALASVPKAASKLGAWSPWAMVAGAAIVGGLLLPQLLPDDSAIEKQHAKILSKTKSGSEYTPPALPDMPSPQALLGRLALGTVVVLGLAVASLYGARRWLKLASPTGATAGDLRLIETLQLGNRCALHLVHLGKREVLIGVDGAGIKTIVPLADSFEDVLADAKPRLVAYPENRGGDDGSRLD